MGFQNGWKLCSHEKAADLGCSVLAPEIRPDYTRLFAEMSPVHTGQITARFKDARGRLHQEFPYLRRRLPSLWRQASAETIRRHIEAHKGRRTVQHCYWLSHPSEPAHSTACWKATVASIPPLEDQREV